MAEESTLTIGVLSPLLAGAFFGVIINGISDYVTARGGRVVAVQTRDAQLGTNYSWASPPFSTPLGRDRVDAFIGIIDAANDEYLAEIKAEGKPVVLVCHHVDGLSCPEVAPDNGSGVADAVDHLVQHGHTRIGFAGAHQGGPGSDAYERYQAYLDTMTRNGLTPDARLTFTSPNFLEDGGDTVAHAVLRAGVPCTALVAASDLIASGVVRTLQAAHVSVPDDVAVVGFDDREFASQMSPSLSTVRQDFRALGERAASLVIDLLEDRPVEMGVHLVGTSFIPRESCGCGQPRLSCLPVLEAASARERLHIDLAAVLGGPNPTVEQQAQLAHLASVVTTCFEGALGTGAPDVDALGAAAEAAYGAFPRRSTIYGVLECVQQYRRYLLEEQGYTIERLTLLDKCVHQLSRTLTSADADTRGRVSSSLQESLREEYFVSLALVGMRGEGADPKALGWLRHTQARSACLALWDSDGDEHHLLSQPLRIAGTMGAGVADYLPVGTQLSVAAFPPVRALTAEGCLEGDTVMVLPVRTAHRYWGFLAVTGKPEAAAATGGDLYFLWTALLGTALDHDALVEEIRSSEERYALAARAANDGLWDWDVSSGSVFYSARWKAMLGYEEDELGSTTAEWFSRVHPDDQFSLESQVAECLEGNLASLECEHRMRTKQGAYRWALCRALAIPGGGRPATRVVGSLTDVTERKELESRLRQAALYDSLTGLPNRSLFTDRLVQAMARANRTPGYNFSVLFMDLDGFKAVNDNLGHVAGDLLLMKVAGRITAHLRQSDTAVRFGGDEFAILLDNVAGSDDPVLIVRRLREKLSAPYEIDGRPVVVTATVGIASSTRGYETPEQMIRDADAAMYAAKAASRAAKCNS